MIGKVELRVLKPLYFNVSKEDWLFRNYMNVVIMMPRQIVRQRVWLMHQKVEFFHDMVFWCDVLFDSNMINKKLQSKSCIDATIKQC